MTRRLLYNLRNSHATQKRDCNKLFENFIYLFNTRFLNQDFDYFEAWFSVFIVVNFCEMIKDGKRKPGYKVKFEYRLT